MKNLIIKNLIFFILLSSSLSFAQRKMPVDIDTEKGGYREYPIRPTDISITYSSGNMGFYSSPVDNQYKSASGSSSGIIVNIPASASLANWVTIDVQMEGPIIGIHFDGTTNNIYEFSCMVDGVAFFYPQPFTTDKDGGNLVNNAYNKWIVGRDFGSGRHLVRWMFKSDNTVSRLWRIWGFLMDNNEFINTRVVANLGRTPFTVPQYNTLGTGGTYAGGGIVIADAGTNQNVTALSKIFFYNGTGSSATAIVVFYNQGVSPTISSIFASVTVPAGLSAEVSFPIPVSGLGQVYVAASTTGLTCNIVGI